MRSQNIYICAPLTLRVSHLNNDFGEELAGMVLPDVTVPGVVVQVQFKVQRVLHVVHARIGLVLRVHLAVEQPVGVYRRHHVRAAAVDLHTEARRQLISRGAGDRQVRVVQLRQAGDAVVRDAAHVHARLVVVERMALELLGREAHLLAPVYGRHVLENGVHRFQQLAADFREVAHLRLLDHAVRLHVVHDVGRPVVD